MRELVIGLALAASFLAGWIVSPLDMAAHDQVVHPVFTPDSSMRYDTSYDPFPSRIPSDYWWGEPEDKPTDKQLLNWCTAALEYEIRNPKSLSEGTP